MNVVHLPVQPAKSRYAAFCEKRQDMVRAFHAWLAENPDARDVFEEIEGTMGVLTGSTAMLLPETRNG